MNARVLYTAAAASRRGVTLPLWGLRCRRRSIPKTREIV
jgi:hypothetical protein